MEKMKLHGIEDITDEKTAPLVFIGLESSRLCPLKCLYCFEYAGTPDEKELSLDERISILNQARALGAKTMVVTGAGEPLVDPLMKDVIEHAHQIGLASFIYTCGWNIDLALARFLYEHDVSLAVKLESLNPETHDFITGRVGSHKRALRSIANLLEAGYSTNVKQPDGSVLTRLEIATLVLKQNYIEIPAIARWVAGKGIKYGVDELGLFGKARDNALLIDPTSEQYREVMGKVTQESLSKKGEACKLWRYGIIINNIGEAKFCAEIAAETAPIGSIRELSLKELLKIKNSKYAARATACGSCILKIEAREQVYGKKIE
ncbi:radical SAM protein [Candidatus Woesearchaeota archaeon]|nr:radical SAM protein [Candidatus Woesearchaeota archaeon]